MGNMYVIYLNRRVRWNLRKNKLQVQQVKVFSGKPYYTIFFIEKNIS